MKSVEEVVRMEECSLSDYLKRADLNDRGVLDVFIRDKGSNELKVEQKEKRKDGLRNLYTDSIRQGLMRKV